MRHSLLNLLKSNKGRGFFRADAGGDTDGDADNDLYIYDIIVSSDTDAEWWGGVSAESVVKTMAAMKGPLEIHLNSPGGDVFGGQAIANAITAYPDPVTVIVDGLAASAAASIAIAADTVLMGGAGSMMMIHKAWTIVIGNADDCRAEAAIMDKIDGRIAGSISAKTGKSEAEVTALLSAGDTWFTADEAIAFGLADGMAPAKEKAGVSNAAAPVWDLSSYGPREAGKTNIEPILEPVAAVEEAAEHAAADDSRARLRRQMRVAGIA